MKKKKVCVAVAMSGGVDSSVSAALLKQAGFEVFGLTMKLGDSCPRTLTPETAKDLFGRKPAEDARKVAEKLGISHKVIDLRSPFENKVIADFCAQYKSGRTPNPCIVCNRTIKFGLLLARARKLGADFLATGHYARIVPDSQSGRFLLKKGKDKFKDQSYFLYTLTQDKLAWVLTPLGDLTKTVVRRLAKAMELPVADKPESQEICFIPDGDYSCFLRKKIPGAFKPGPIIDLDGRVLGEHRGIPGYTIGQRRGLGIAAPRPLYVVSIDAGANTLVVGPDEALAKRSLTASGVSLISGGRIKRPFKAKVKIRYKHAEAPAVISPLGKNEIRIDFEKPQRAITPGQTVVFYAKDTVLGGGTIVSAIE